MWKEAKDANVRKEISVMMFKGYKGEIESLSSEKLMDLINKDSGKILDFIPEMHKVKSLEKRKINLNGNDKLLRALFFQMNTPIKNIGDLFNTEKLAEKLLILSTDNSQLSKLNKTFYKVSKGEVLKAKWMLSRPKLLKQWTSTFSKLCESSSMFCCFCDWLAYRYWPAYDKKKIVNSIMCNPLVIIVMLRDAVKNKNKEQIQLFWNILACEGSLLGIAYLVDENILKDTICDQVSMVTRAYYSCMVQNSEMAREASQHFIDLLLECRPLKSTIEEHLFYSVMRNDAKSVAYALVHCNTFDHLIHSLCKAKIIDANIYNMIVHAMNADDKDLWSKFVSAYEEIESDTQASYKIINDYLDKIYQESNQGKFHFSDYWLLFLEAAVRLNNPNSIKNLLDLKKYKRAKLSVSFGIVSLAIELGDYNVCDMLVPYLDLSLSDEMKPLDRLIFLLNQLCQLRPRAFFSRIWPFHDLTLSDTDIKKKCKENQVKCLEYIVKTIRKLEPNFAIDSRLIWQASQDRNFAMAQKLQELGGTVQWMDSMPTGKNQMNLPTSLDLKYQVDDSQSGLFQAYGGRILKSDSPNFVSKSPDFNEFVKLIETNGIDYSRTRRRSSTDITTSKDFESITKPSALLWGLRSDSCKKGNNRMDARVAICRKSSVAAQKSENHWTKFFKSAMEDQTFLRSTTNMKHNSEDEFEFEWMESSNVPALPSNSTGEKVPESAELLQMVWLF